RISAVVVAQPLSGPDSHGDRTRYSEVPYARWWVVARVHRCFVALVLCGGQHFSVHSGMVALLQLGSALPPDHKCNDDGEAVLHLHARVLPVLSEDVATRLPCMGRER